MNMPANNMMRPSKGAGAGNRGGNFASGNRLNEKTGGGNRLNGKGGGKNPGNANRRGPG
jgi:hypothetical protein